ncbi:Hypothetical_protein [Hexamita inflata]|uniref:Hypothetical_protein n=1 Tax=Hexamita inflata TaxID=28002 RepID=A0ABP1HB30_9EUKA
MSKCVSRIQKRRQQLKKRELLEHVKLFLEPSEHLIKRRSHDLGITNEQLYQQFQMCKTLKVHRVTDSRYNRAFNIRLFSQAIFLISILINKQLISFSQYFTHNDCQNSMIETQLLQLISRGKYSNCFNDNDSYVKPYHGYIVVLLFPTFRCINTIATAQGQQLIVNTPFKAKVFITYTDNSTTIHDSLQLTVEQSVFIPENKFTPQSVPVRIKLAQPDISQYFDQKIQNGVITKDMKIFQVQLYFLNTNYTVPIVKTTRTYINFYLLAGIQNVYSKLSLMFQANGFILKKELNQNAAAANALLTSLGVDSYQIQYTVVMYDVEKTEELRVRLIGQGLDNNQFNNVARQSNCKLRFPNQGCEELMNKLKQMNLYDTTPYITYIFYKGDQIVTNYSKVFDEFVDSCFSTGLLEYNNDTETLTIIINPNEASKFCTLKRNDVLTVEISLGNNSQQLTSLIIDYVPGVQNYTISGFDLTLHPEIRIQYYRSGEFQDAVSLTDYIIQVNANLLQQELMILLYVLSANFGFIFLYVLIVVLAIPACKNRVLKSNRKLKEIKLDEEA